MKNPENITKQQLIKENDLLKAKIVELEKNKKISQIIANSTSDNIAITTFDLKAEYLYVSPSVKQVLGYDPTEMVGKSFFDFIHPGDKKVLLQMVKKYIKLVISKVLNIDDPKITEAIEFRFRDKAGNWRNMQSTINFVGKNLLAVTRDVTVQKKAEEALLQRENYLSALNRAKEGLLNSGPEHALQQFVDILGPASNASRTYIFINHKNENGGLLMSKKAEYCAGGINPEIDNPDLQNLKYDDFFDRWNRTLSLGEIIFGKIKYFPKGEKEFLEIQDIKAILVIPIMTNNKFVGFIGFDNCLDEREWDTAEQNFLKAAASDLARFIERKKALGQIEAENIRFQTTMDALDAVVYVADMQTHELLYLNKRGKSICGDKLGEKCYFALQNGQTKPCGFCTNHLLLDETGNPKEPYVWEFQNTITKKWYQLRDQAILWPEERIVRLEIATDITERKKAEETIKRNLEFQKLISSISSNFVGSFHIDNSINNLLKSIGEYSNASRSYVFRLRNNGKTMDNTHEWCAEGVAPQIDNLQNLTTDIFPWNMARLNNNEIVHIKDVSKLPGEARVEKQLFESQNIKSIILLPLSIFGELIGFIGFDNVEEAKAWSIESIEILKISSEILANTIHSKNAENELKQNKNDLSEAQRIAKIGSWNFDITNQSLQWSDEVYRIFQLEKSEVPSVYDAFIETIHPGDRDFVLQSYANSITNKIPYNITHRLLLKDGTIKYVNERCETFCDDNNKPIRSIGTVHDITEQKKAEISIKASEANFKAIFENKGTATGIFDKDMTIISCNSKFEELSGYSKQEVEGIMKWPKIIAKQDIERLHQYHLQRTEKAGTPPTQYECGIIKKNGEQIYCAVNIGMNGTERIASLIDITKRKQAEVNLQIQHRLAVIASGSNSLGFIMESLLKLSLQLDGVDCGGVYLVDGETGAINLKYHKGLSHGFVQSALYYGAGSPNVKLINRGKPMYHDYSDILPHTKDDIRKKEGLKATAIIPIRIKEETIAVLDVASRTHNEIPENSRLSLESLSAQLGSAIIRARAIEELKESEEKFRSIFEAATDGIVYVDKKTRILDVNPAFTTITGIAKEDVIGKTAFYLAKKFVGFKQLPDILKLIKAKLSNKSVTPIELEFNNKILEVYASEISFRGKITGVIRDITARKQSENELRKSRGQYKSDFEQFRLMADNSTDMMWAKDMEGKFTFTNKAICKNLINAKDVNEAIGKDVMFFVERERGAHPENKQWFTFGEECGDSDAITIQKKKTCRFDEYGNVFGKYLYLDVYKTPLWDDNGEMIGTVGNARIVTKEREIEKALKENESRLKAFSEATYEGIFITENGVVIDMNEAACNMSGYSYNELKGKSALIMIAPESKGLAEKNMLSGYDKPYDAIAQRKDGTKFFVEILGREFEYKGKKARMTAVRDISLRKKHEILLQESKEKLQQFNSQLLDLVEAEVEKSREKDRMMQIQSKQAAMGEMIGNIAHQWRQPLNEIGLYVQNLQDIYEFEELTAETLNEIVEKTMVKLEYMSQTIDDFRNFFRSDKEKTRFLLKDSINKTLSLTEASFKNKFVKIGLYLQEDIYITGYPNEFSQVVLNILNNAKDILVERKVENPQVTINLSGQGEKVILTIADNAGGIDENIIDKIFEPYFTTRGQITGTGLGLYISKTIIERNMAGRLSVKNIEGGAEFKIEL